MGELWQKYRWSASAAGVAWVLYALWLWQPERQVHLHQKHFVDAAESRNWRRFGAFIDANYADRWGHDKPFVIRETSEVLRQFFVLTIQREDDAADAGNGSGTISQRLKLEGDGTPIAQYAMRAVNSVATPFVFEWRQKSWRPWDWKLVRAENAELRISGGFDF